MPMATKLGRMVTYFDKLLPIKSNAYGHQTDPESCEKSKMEHFAKIVKN